MLANGSVIPNAGSSWTILLWFQSQKPGSATTLIAGLGSDLDVDSRYLGLLDGYPALRLGKGNQLTAAERLPEPGWHQLAATLENGVATLYVDGKQASSGKLLLGAVSPAFELAPADLPAGENLSHFGGQISGFEVLAEVLSPHQIADRYLLKPENTPNTLVAASHFWEVQLKQHAGLTEPQDPSLMPHSRAELGHGVAQPLAPPQPALQPLGGGRWRIAANWQLAAAPQIHRTGAQISSPGKTEKAAWLSAIVPGTVLTTLINRGIYPDPDFGLNNLAIPESLNKQDYWYRVRFPTPSNAKGHRVALTFNGINYAAEVWLNGIRIGGIRGAFIRGTFDVTAQLAPAGLNELAVRVSPPPHPGIPQEQSIKGGPGPNGGVLCLDGPTFVATEGWDWIPGVRDRDTGIWQDVVLSLSGNLQLGDPQVVTHLPLPDISSADISIAVPVINSSSSPVEATLHAVFEGVDVSTKVTAAPGTTTVTLKPKDFPQLHLPHPRLWWPNGYGRPELYHLRLSVSGSGGESDSKETSFGVREVSYQVSLFNHEGRLQRSEVSPTEAHLLGVTPVDVTHEGIRETAHGWAASLTPAGESSPAVKTVSNENGLTDLVILVNGVRIAARGGNWGMDDSRKRVSREHLEPFFRLHRDANLNLIRNWVGQNSEEVFYQLADEYGLMVWNDFWESTQDYNLEPEDPELFLRNARDVIARFRNHPSIVIWCGRNEGVPQPTINKGLIQAVAELDGTRYYTPSSRDVNLRGSGPYMYQDPAFYYGDHNSGFSVELGIPSFSTLESFQHAIAPADQWPISDAWAYHDWHQSAGGDTHPWMKKMEEELGAATDLKDFERKAQMFNYVDHRAIFEGFNQHLWSPNSGRLLWMTQPAWPSNSWQIMNSDYDTSASYYAVKKACEPVHVQLDLTNNQVTLVDTTRTDTGPLQISAKIFSLQNKLLWSHAETVNAIADATTPIFLLDAATLQADDGVKLVRLEAHSQSGELVTDNFYWLAAKDSDYRQLDGLGPAGIEAVATAGKSNGQNVVEVRLRNRGEVPAIEIKLVPRSLTTGERILPAYLSDNYVSLLPGEERTVSFQSSQELNIADVSFGIRGWNVPEASISVSRSSAHETH